MIREGTPRFFRSAFTTFSGVAANFAGIPLAFAFIATLGTIGIVTQFLANLGFDPYQHGFTLFSKTGVELVYLYFQIPLMILVIAPAIDGLRREWREAAANLGATPRQFWRHVGLPVLAPSLLGAVVLLFGNSFAAYATAYGLTGGSVPLVPIRIGFYLSGDVLSNPHLGAGARGRDVRRARRDDGHLHPAPADLLEVGAMRRRISASAVLWLFVGAAYFLIPLVATLLFSLKDDQTGQCCSLSSYSYILHDPAFWKNLRISFILSVETIVIALLLLIPTVYWVHLKLPRLRPVIGFLALVPVRRAADHPRGRPARRLQGLARRGSTRSRTASSWRRT